LLEDGPGDARSKLLFAHGAGAPMDSPFMNDFAQGLAARGLGVVRFEFPYMRDRREGGKRGPDPQPVLLASFRHRVQELGGGARLVLGGKSMGGRMASMIADEVGARGLVCLGYPFHPPKRPEKTRTAHLATLRTPALIVQGTRDPFGSPGEIASYVLAPSIRVALVDDGDHDLVPRKKSGRTAAQAMSEVIDLVAAFVSELG
jgi:predicted alpha/beta-hydrolase family hydrolase